MKRNIRKRTVFRSASTFASVSPNTQEVSTDILAELTTDNSRLSIVVDSFKGMRNSDGAVGAVIIILKRANQSKSD